MRHGKTTLAKLVSERALISFLDKSRTERIGNGEYAPDHKRGPIIRLARS